MSHESLPNDLRAAQSAAVFLASKADAIHKSLPIVGRPKLRRLVGELGDQFDERRKAIRAVENELRETRHVSARFDDIVAPTAHEAAIKLIFAVNREFVASIPISIGGSELYLLEVMSDPIHNFPDARDIIAEVHIEAANAATNRRKSSATTGICVNPPEEVTGNGASASGLVGHSFRPLDEDKENILKRSAQWLESAPGRTGRTVTPETPPAGNDPTKTSDAQAASTPATTTTHSDDFTSVCWFGTCYQFSKGQQAEAARVLWKAWENKTPSLSEQTIREKIRSSNDHFRLDHVFKPPNRSGKRQPHPAWGTMIKSVGKGIFALSPPESQI